MAERKTGDKFLYRESCVRRRFTMSGKISNSMVPAAILLVVSLILSYWLMSRDSTAYSASAPTVTTLSAITEGATTPIRVAVDQSGNLYVTDPRSGGVLKYNSAGNLLQKISTTGKNLMGVAIAKNGDILSAREQWLPIIHQPEPTRNRSGFSARQTASRLTPPARFSLPTANSTMFRFLTRI
jgi:hypothetical protein